MADNLDVTPGTGRTVAADEVGGILYQRVKIAWGADGAANDVDAAANKPFPTQIFAPDGSAIITSTLDCSTSVQRPANTTAYTANTAWANSTSAPAAGGFTFANACANAGGGGIITDLTVVSTNPAGTPLRGELWLFDSAVTELNDAVAFALSDANALLYLGKVPFELAVDAVNNSVAHVTGINLTFHCVGTVNLRFLIKVLNAYTPASGETLTCRIKGERWG